MKIRILAALIGLVAVAALAGWPELSQLERAYPHGYAGRFGQTVISNEIVNVGSDTWVRLHSLTNFNGVYVKQIDVRGATQSAGTVFRAEAVRRFEEVQYRTYVIVTNLVFGGYETNAMNQPTNRVWKLFTNQLGKTAVDSGGKLSILTQTNFYLMAFDHLNLCIEGVSDTNNSFDVLVDVLQ